MTLERGVEVFVTAFCLSKSRAHPYLAERFEELWIMQDGPGRKTARKSEVVACGVSPGDVVEKIKRSGLGWHFLCDIQPCGDNFEQVRSAYKLLGYRAIGTEWFFDHGLEKTPICESHPPVLRVASKAVMDSIPQLANHPRKLLEGSRQFAIWDDQRDYGWVTSIPMGAEAWVSDLFVHADVRGKGYGRALMSALLRSDKENGVETSVLLASTAGARLYPHMGYRQIGVLQVFCPFERD